MKKTVWFTLVSVAMLAIPFSVTSAAAADAPENSGDWCRACLDLDCQAYLDYPCDVSVDWDPVSIQQAKGPLDWCSMCWDLDCQTQLHYPCGARVGDPVSFKSGQNPVEFEECRICMDLECYMLRYPCGVIVNSPAKPQMCKACMDLECYSYIPYPCWSSRAGATVPAPVNAASLA